MYLYFELSTMSKVIYQELINYFGSQVATGKAIGVSQPTVCGYVTDRWNMTPIVAMRAEVATKGKFKAVDLCPALKTVVLG